MKKIRIISLLAALVLLLSACVGGGTGGTETPEVTQPMGDGAPQNFALVDFQLVRPDKASSTVTAAMTSIKNAMKEVTGKNPTLKTDYKATDEIACEILIGTTNRQETAIVQSTMEPGDYKVQTVITDTGIKVVLLGYNDTLTAAAADEFVSLLKSGAVMNAEGNFVEVNSSHNFIDEYKDFHIELGEPIVAFQAKEEDNHWGHYQFPQIYYTSTGAIRVTWSYHDDSIYSNISGSGAAASNDGGKTWYTQPGFNVGARVYDDAKALTSDGLYFTGFSGKGAYDMDYSVLSKYTPVIRGGLGDCNIYLAEDVKEYTYKQNASFYNPRTGSVTNKEVTVNWPYMPLNVFKSQTTGLYTYVYPTEAFMGISSYMGMVSTEDGLYYCTYARGVDSKTGEAGAYHGYYSVYVFHSPDGGETWNYKSQISMTRKLFAIANANKNCEGFCEPSMTVTADGIFIMLLRTGSNNPLFIVTSTDKGETWSAPVVFDDCGVLPQLLTLDCGVTIATYGRPRLYVRATSDPTGKTWQDHIEIKLSGADDINGFNKSCHYTYLLRIDATSAYMVYSEFLRPNADGLPRRSIIVRKISVVPNEA